MAQILANSNLARGCLGKLRRYNRYRS